MRKFVFILLYLFSISINNIYSQDHDCKSADEAIHYFVDNIKKGDIEHALMVSPYYHDNIIRNFNAREYIRWMGAILPRDSIIFTSEFLLLNKYGLLSGFSFGIKIFIWSFLLNESERLLPLSRVNPMYVYNDNSLIDEYLSLLNMDKLRTIEIVRVDLYKPDLQSSERNTQLKEVQQRIFGFNEQWQYTVLYKFNNKYYVGGFTSERYQNNWYISSLGCMFANIVYGLEQVSGLVEYLYKYGYELE
jgi:hypothetical protein